MRSLLFPRLHPAASSRYPSCSLARATPSLDPIPLPRAATHRDEPLHPHPDQEKLPTSTSSLSPSAAPLRAWASFVVSLLAMTATAELPASGSRCCSLTPLLPPCHRRTPHRLPASPALSASTTTADRSPCLSRRPLRSSAPPPPQLRLPYFGPRMSPTTASPPSSRARSARPPARV